MGWWVGCVGSAKVLTPAPPHPSHFDKITMLGAEAHINTCFKHFGACGEGRCVALSLTVPRCPRPSTPTHPTHPNTPAVYFVLEFDLVERKELAPLEELISSLCVGAAK